MTITVHVNKPWAPESTQSTRHRRRTAAGAACLLVTCCLCVLLSTDGVRAAGYENKAPARMSSAGPKARHRAPCATSCHHENCDSVNLRYGKFCGVGHTGCPGEEPCDAADACCKGHDECVEQHSVLSPKCHQAFLNCLDQVLLDTSHGFSTQCPLSQVVPIMRRGIELTMMFGSALQQQGQQALQQQRQQQQQQQQHEGQQHKGQRRKGQRQRRQRS